MRRQPPALLLLTIAVVLLLTASPAVGDTIYFKNGTSIEVANAREIEGYVVYNAGKEVYKVPRSQVERIVKSRPAFSDIKVEKVRSGQAISMPAGSEDFFRTGPPGAGKADSAGELPESATKPTGQASEPEPVRLSPSELAQIEKQAHPLQAAGAYFSAARYELGQQNPEQALAYLKRALTLVPDHPRLQEWQAHALLQLNRYAEAADVAQRATRADPKSATAFRLLGSALYEMEKTNDAVAAWRRSQALSPNPNVEKLLAKAERDANVEDKLRNSESTHFSLRYEGPAISVALQRGILPTLENQYLELRSTLGNAPPHNLLVMVYGNQTYQDVTEGPEWAGGEYDGRLRIRARGVDTLTPDFARTLKHELAHSFIGYMTKNRCPGWLNEGMAQMLEPRQWTQRAPELLAAFQAKKAFPLQALERGFGRFGEEDAHLAYLQAVATVEYIRSRHGMNSLLGLLEEMGRGVPHQQALRNVLRMDYEDLDKEVAEHWQRTYGKQAAGRR